MHTSTPLPPPKVHNQSKANAKTKTKCENIKAVVLLRSMVHQSIFPPPLMLVRSTAKRKKETPNTLGIIFARPWGTFRIVVVDRPTKVEILE